MEALKSSKYFEELKIALKAAEEAGEIIDEYAEGKADSWKKKNGSSVTEADIKSQEKIVEIISEEFPEDGFLGEEEHLEPKGEDQVWIIDPIDGTFNFDRGYGNYCVLIALEVGGETKLGIIHSPSSGQNITLFGIKENGAYKTESKIEEAEQIEVSEHDKIKESIFYLTAFDIYKEELEKEKEALTKLAERGAVHRQVGSAGLELGDITLGKADFLVNPLLKEWDFTAPKLIIEEAGGRVRIRESCFPNSYEVIASNGKLQSEIEEIVGNIFQ